MLGTKIKTEICIRLLFLAPVSVQSALKLSANGVVDQEVDGAVDGQEEMADSGQDGDPDWCLVTRAGCVVDHREEEVHCHIEK